jgi:hypothetical protein
MYSLPKRNKNVYLTSHGKVLDDKVIIIPKNKDKLITLHFYNILGYTYSDHSTLWRSMFSYLENEFLNQKSVYTFKSGELCFQMNFKIDLKNFNLVQFVIGLDGNNKWTNINTENKGYPVRYKDIEDLKDEEKIEENLIPFNDKKNKIYSEDGINLSEFIDTLIENYDETKLDIHIVSCARYKISRINTECPWIPFREGKHINEFKEYSTKVMNSRNPKGRRIYSTRIRTPSLKTSYDDLEKRIKEGIIEKIDINEVIKNLVKLMNYAGNNEETLRLSNELKKIKEIMNEKTPVISYSDMCRILSIKNYVNSSSLESKKNSIDPKGVSDNIFKHDMYIHGGAGEDITESDLRDYYEDKMLRNEESYNEILMILKELEKDDTPLDAAFGTVLALAFGS